MNRTDDQKIPAQRTRSIGESIVWDRAARQLVSEAMAPIANWQSEIAVLANVLAREPSEARKNAASFRCHQVLDAVRQSRVRVLKGLDNQPEHLRRHGRVEDLLNALATLETKIATLLAAGPTFDI